MNEQCMFLSVINKYASSILANQHNNQHLIYDVFVYDTSQGVLLPLIMVTCAMCQAWKACLIQNSGCIYAIWVGNCFHKM